MDSHDSLFTSLSPHAPDVPSGLDPKETHRVALGQRSVVSIIGKGIESSEVNCTLGLQYPEAPKARTDGLWLRSLHVKPGGENSSETPGDVVRRRCRGGGDAADVHLSLAACRKPPLVSGLPMKLETGGQSWRIELATCHRGGCIRHVRPA